MDGWDNPSGVCILELQIFPSPPTCCIRFSFLEHLNSHRRPHAARIAVVKEATNHRYPNVSVPVPGELLTHPKLTTETDCWCGAGAQEESFIIYLEPNEQM